MFVGTRIRTVLFFFTFIAVACYAYIQATVVGTSAEVYGSILSRDETSIRGATVEKIALYPQKMAHSREKIMRKAVLVKLDDAEAIVLISHGFMCTKDDVAFLRSLFPKCSSMVFDMRGHGEDTDGQYCTFGRDEAFDVMAAARFLRNHPDLKGKPLLVYGFSMGAVASIEAQAKDSKLFDGMILDCPFDTSENIIKQGLENMKISLFGYEFTIPGRSLLQKYVFHPYVQSFVKVVLKAIAKMDTRNIKAFMYPFYPAESVKRVSAPIFLIHCKNDEMIPVDSIKRIYRNAASEYKKLWITNGRRHYDSYFANPEVYARRVGNFVQKVVRGELSSKKKQRIIEDAGPASVDVHVQVGRVEEGNK